MKKALICGISGQDGAYLTQFLLRKGYKIYRTSRYGTRLVSMSQTDFTSRISVYPMGF